MRSPLAALLLAMTTLACAGNETEASAPPAKPGGSGDETLAEAALVGLETTSSPARPPRPALGRDLRARAYGASPVGPIGPDHVDEYPVHVEIVSRAREPVAVEHARTSVQVSRAGRVLRGCDGGAPVAIDAPHVIAPRESFVAVATLPCPITQPGEYDVSAIVEIGEQERGTGWRLVAHMPLVVQPGEPFRGDSLRDAHEAAEADTVEPPRQPDEVRRQQPGIGEP